MRITSEGFAVVDSDTHLSKWVEAAGYLEVVGEVLARAIFRHVTPGMTVCDVGACIGDHTSLYARLVGEHGKVYAFEPNPEAFECLAHNMRGQHNVSIFPCGLGRQQDTREVVALPNLGASHLSARSGGAIEIKTLDEMAAAWGRLDFLKVDAEGMEPEVLDGAARTIAHFKPVMLIEVAAHTLDRFGYRPEDIYRRLDALGYGYESADPRYPIGSNELDIICTFKNPK